MGCSECDVSLHSPRFPQLDISLWFVGESKLGQGPKAAMFGGDRSGVMDVITSSGVTPIECLKGLGASRRWCGVLVWCV